MQFPLKLVSIVVSIVAILLSIPLMFGINDAGHRTIIQYPTGTLVVKFTPGVYTQWFGTVTEYVDVITLDFDKVSVVDAGTTASLTQKGISVRYQDGGTGHIYGKARFALPNDEATMIKLHKDFRTNSGVGNKLIKSVAEESMNLTAGLMSSEDAYAVKRGTFTEWAHEQVAKGKFLTKLQEVTAKEEGTNKVVVKNVPIIDFAADGKPKRAASDFKEYGITVSGFQITDWDFEAKTLEQIQTKRTATMAIITADAQAAQAQSEAKTAEEQGKKAVMIAQYQKEVLKVQAVVDAQREQEVAVLAAKREVQVAEQQKLQAAQKRLAAIEYKQEQILRGEGDGAYKRIVMEADGALAPKLEAYEKVMGKFAEEFGKQKWVPEVQMGGAGAGASGAGSVSTMIETLTIPVLKQLSLDMKMEKGRRVTDAETKKAPDPAPAKK